MPKPFLDDDFVDALPDDALLAARELCLQFERAIRAPDVRDLKAEEADGLYLDALGLLSVWAERLEDFPFPLSEERLSHSPAENIQTITAATNKWKVSIEVGLAKQRMLNAREKYQTRLGMAFGYQFEEKDLSRLQELINKLRDEVTACDALGDEHRQRLLARLEKLQAELHKRVSDLDLFWGLIGDAGVATQKLGDAAKPIVETIYTMTQIVWKVTCIAHQLSPSPLPPLLPQGSETEG